VEINCSPWRLDLNWRWHQAALKDGCLMSIDPDAHSVPEMLRWGVGVARKGGVQAEAVLTASIVSASKSISINAKPSRPDARVESSGVLLPSHFSPGLLRRSAYPSSAASGSPKAEKVRLYLSSRRVVGQRLRSFRPA
jgi:hypothetical protein